MNIEKILETMPDLAEVGLKSRVFNEETLVGLSAAVEDTLKQELVLGDASGESALAFGPGSSASGGKAIALGDSCRAEGLRSIAAGFGNVASAPQSLALGLRAKTLPDDYQAFVWNPQLCADGYYESQGKGTFCVNPEGGLSGFYVGGKAFAEILSGFQPAGEYVDPRRGVVLSGGLSAAGQTEISGNFRQGASFTKGTGASCDSEGVPSWTEMEGVRAAALNKSASLGENSFAANAAAAYGKNSAAFGNSKAFASYSVANGADVSAMGYASHAEGRQTQTGLPEKIGSSSTLQDYGAFAHAEGCSTSAVGMHSHAEGRNSWSEGENSHAEGEGVSAVGYASHAEGRGAAAGGGFSHAEGSKSTTEGDYSHAEGDQCLAKGESSHAEGYMSTAEGGCSHAEGDQCLAKGQKSHAEGASVSAVGYASHAEGRDTVAEARCSHAEGACAQAQSGHDYSFVWSGRYNPHHSYYKSRGPGTFCVNPEGGLSGFYVGGRSLAETLDAAVGAAYEAAKAQYEGFISAGVTALSAAGALDLSVSPAGSTMFYPSQAIMAEYAANPTSILAAATVALVGVIGAAGSVKAE